MRDITRLPFYIDRVLFPCTKEELLENAEENLAPDQMIKVIEDLPEISFSGINQVMLKLKDINISSDVSPYN